MTGERDEVLEGLTRAVETLQTEVAANGAHDCLYPDEIAAVRGWKRWVIPLVLCLVGSAGGVVAVYVALSSTYTDTAADVQHLENGHKEHDAELRELRRDSLEQERRTAKAVSKISEQLGRVEVHVEQLAKKGSQQPRRWRRPRDREGN